MVESHYRSIVNCSKSFMIQHFCMFLRYSWKIDPLHESTQFILTHVIIRHCVIKRLTCNSQKEHQRCSEGGTIIPGSNGNTANSWGAFIISSITILRTTFYRTHT